MSNCLTFEFTLSLPLVKDVTVYRKNVNFVSSSAQSRMSKAMF